VPGVRVRNASQKERSDYQPHMQNPQRLAPRSPLKFVTANMHTQEVEVCNIEIRGDPIATNLISAAIHNVTVWDCVDAQAFFPLAESRKFDSEARFVSEPAPSLIIVTVLSPIQLSLITPLFRPTLHTIAIWWGHVWTIEPGPFRYLRFFRDGGKWVKLRDFASLEARLMRLKIIYVLGLADVGGCVSRCLGE
jgi:hypothetical protein